ncbi:MAG: hypothetical protein KDK70_30405 [Myxococcales bacterium]|nr:hypothetical protein [Myxococcales bacterium]
MKTPGMRAMGAVGVGALLAVACVLPPQSAGDDDDGPEATDTEGPDPTTGVPPGMTSVATTSADGSDGPGPDDAGDGPDTSDDPSDTGDDGPLPDMGGDPECTGLGPAGLPGANLGSIWVPIQGGQPAGKLSKIDTQTMVETARYLTRPDPDANPIEVSVSLSGAVVVGDRGTYDYPITGGSLTVFHGDAADCVDANGDGMISTSTGPADVRAWSDEECRAWYLPRDYYAQYGVAWTPGTLDPATCTYEGEQIWTVGMRQDETIEVLLVDGDTGAIDGTVDFPPFPPSNYGTYEGMAVDAAGNLWAARKYDDVTLVRVDRQTLDVQSWLAPANAFGLTVGRSGYVFLCAQDVSRFDEATQTWLVAPAIGGGIGECMEDDQGRLWLSAWDAAALSYSLVALDIETFATVESHPLGGFDAYGVALDFQGHLWGLSWDDAYRVDLATGAQQPYGGLSFAKVRSADMTGYALASVVAGP